MSVSDADASEEVWIVDWEKQQSRDKKSGQEPY